MFMVESSIMRRIVIVLLTLAATAFTMWSAGQEAGALAPTPCSDGKPVVKQDIAYLPKPVSDLQRLDVYGFRPSGDCENVPVVVYVHGGGWRKGDKQQVGDKATFFNDLGYVFVSVNYRLSDPVRDPNRPQFPDHPKDVGAAVSWVERNAGDFGGNGKQLALIGHSAGAHLVSLVGVDPSFIDDSGGTAESVRCVVSDDTEGYDVVARTAQGGIVQRIYQNAFGTDPTVQRDASPLNHVSDRDHPPDFLVITRGTPTRVTMARDFAAAVEAAGANVDVLEATGLTHGDVNRLIGTADDTVVTPAVQQFVTDCLG